MEEGDVVVLYHITVHDDPRVVLDRLMYPTASFCHGRQATICTTDKAERGIIELAWDDDLTPNQLAYVRSCPGVDSIERC